jgi:hypothetical protein
MDMSNNKFDSYFRNKLQDQSSPVPPDMWERIHPEKRRRRSIIFWIWVWRLTGPSTLFACLSTCYLLLTPHLISTPARKTVLTASKPHVAPQHSIRSIEQFNKQPIAHRSNIASRQSVAPRSPYDPAPSDHSPVTYLSYDPASSTIHLHATGRGPVPPITASPLPAKTPEKKKPSPPGKPNWYLEAYGSPNPPFAAAPDGSNRMPFTAGLRLTIPLYRHFICKTGVQYAQTGNTQTTHLGDSASNYNPGNPPSLIARTSHARLKNIDIPILIGYETSIHFLKAGINTGVIFNAYASNIPAQRLSFYVGLYLSAHMYKRLSLFTEPYFRHRLSHIDVSYPNNNAAGLTFGLRYDFTDPGQQK